MIPENELTRAAGIELSETTKGAVVDDNLMSSLEGVFSCGNVLHVHDLVDFVSMEGTKAGRNAARYLKMGAVENKAVSVKDGFGVNGVVPQKILFDGDDEVEFMFRPKNKYKNCKICIDVDGNCIKEMKKMVVTPGEMCSFRVERTLLNQAEQDITVRLEV